MVKGLVFFDYDGTLVDERDGIYAPTTQTIESVSKLQKNGYYCFLATGRALSYLPKAIHTLNLDGFVTSNGAVISLNHEIIHGEYFKEEQMKEMMEYCKTHRLNYFLEVKDKEIEKQKTLIGPHLDDFKVLLNNEDISLFGSQGQNRLAILSIKLGLLKFINESNYENAIVVLDDVLSELDINKRKSLLNLLSSSNQVFITTANKSDVENIEIKNVQYYEIVNGKIKEE